MIIFRRYKIKKLIKDLEKAEIYLSKFKGGYSESYLCAEDFHKDFKLELEELKNGNEKKILTFFDWFLPTFEWDDFTNSDENSVQIGVNIFNQLKKLKPNS
jgi:hypothetical protein